MGVWIVNRLSRELKFDWWRLTLGVGRVLRSQQHASGGALGPPGAQEEHPIAVAQRRWGDGGRGGAQKEGQWRWPGGSAGAAGNPEIRRAAMGIHCVAIGACGRGKMDPGVPRMAVRTCWAAAAGAAVVALLSAAIALHWPPLHAGTGRGRLCGREDPSQTPRRAGVPAYGADSAWRVRVQRWGAGAAGLTEDLAPCSRELLANLG